MFWGGSLPPLNVAPLNLVPGFIWFVLKIMVGILFYVWLRATLPRLRYDALMNLGWKRMLPMLWMFLARPMGNISTGSSGMSHHTASEISAVHQT